MIPPIYHSVCVHVHDPCLCLCFVSFCSTVFFAPSVHHAATTLLALPSAPWFFHLRRSVQAHAPASAVIRGVLAPGCPAARALAPQLEKSHLQSQLKSRSPLFESLTTSSKYSTFDNFRKLTCNRCRFNTTWVSDDGEQLNSFWDASAACATAQVSGWAIMAPVSD